MLHFRIVLQLAPVCDIFLGWSVTICLCETWLGWAMCFLFLTSGVEHTSPPINWPLDISGRGRYYWLASRDGLGGEFYADYCSYKTSAGDQCG